MNSLCCSGLADKLHYIESIGPVYLSSCSCWVYFEWNINAMQQPKKVYNKIDGNLHNIFRKNFSFIRGIIIFLRISKKIKLLYWKQAFLLA